MTSILIPSGCREPAPPFRPLDPVAFSGERAMGAVRTFVELGPKVSGTPGAAEAADRIAAQLRESGLAVETDAFQEVAPRGETTFRNVLGRRPGSGSGMVVVGCHYDTKSGIGEDFRGANDSGSGVGLLLELARILGRQPAGQAEVLLAFFDGEECVASYGPHDGLHGSRRLAERLRREGKAPQVRGVLIVDMVGDRDLTITIPRNGTPELITAVFESAREEGARMRFSLLPAQMLDDHTPFLEAGMPAVDLIDFEYGSAPGLNDYWHTAADTIDKLSAQSLETVGRVVVRVLNRLEAEASAPAAR